MTGRSSSIVCAGCRHRRRPTSASGAAWTSSSRRSKPIVDAFMRGTCGTAAPSSDSAIALPRVLPRWLGAQADVMPGPYELYLVRHGVAEQRGEAWPDDSKRPLTEQGISRLRKSARGLARIGVGFDVILTSPLVRARQTAEVVAGALDARPPIVIAE